MRATTWQMIDRVLGGVRRISTSYHQVASMLETAGVAVILQWLMDGGCEGEKHGQYRG
jgi:hypothetical protein